MTGQIYALKWCYRTQESFYLAMQALANNELLYSACLPYPIDVLRRTEDVAIIVAMIQAFSIVKLCMTSSLGLCGLWLAVLIHRSCSDLAKTIDLLITTRILGEFDEN